MKRRTWFITGVTGGLGHALAEQLLERGDRVFATARQDDPRALRSLRRHGERFCLDRLDLTDASGIRATVTRAFDAMGMIDVVVSNAGYALIGAAEEVSDEQLQHQLAVNLFGPIQLVRAALPRLREQGGGRILQLCGMGGQIGLPGMSLYHASKWALEGFFESTMLDIAPFNIQVTLVDAGHAATEFLRANARMADPLAIYDDSITGHVRRYVAGGNASPPGDPIRMAQAMIDCVARDPAPRRLILGSDAYGLIHEALSERLAELEAGRAVALSTDREPTYPHLVDALRR